MRALRFHQYGGPEVLRFEDDVPIPEPGTGQIQVQVSGVGVNPVDWKVREGYLQAVFPVEFPVTVAWEFSGTVSKLGQGVTKFSVGDEVFGTCRTGSAAEYLVAQADTTARKPAGMDLPDAAAIPIAGVTAWQALFDAADLQPGQRVLIQAASGGVGTFAVQLAKWKGAYVIGTASAKNHHLLRELGCDELIDYRTTPFETVVKGVDVVLETVGGDENMLKSLSVLKPGGILVSITSAEPAEEAAAQGKRAVHVFMNDNSADLDKLSALIQDLRVRPIIDTVVPFAKAIEAEKESQTGHAVGKLVIDMRR